MNDSTSPEKPRWPAFDDVPEARRRTMRAIRGKDTKPEMLLRRHLHKLGYRYSLHYKGLPGSPYLAFPLAAKLSRSEAAGGIGIPAASTAQPQDESGLLVTKVHEKSAA
jgi:hypothetical protein